MKDTCTDDCKFWKKYKDKCPNYIETTWTSEDNIPSVFKDCAPKRNVIMTMDLMNKFNGLQVAVEQDRNMQHRVVQELISMKSKDVKEITSV